MGEGRGLEQGGEGAGGRERRGRVGFGRDRCEPVAHNPPPSTTNNPNNPYPTNTNYYYPPPPFNLYYHPMMYDPANVMYPPPAHSTPLDYASVPYHHVQIERSNSNEEGGDIIEDVREENTIVDK